MVTLLSSFVFSCRLFGPSGACAACNQPIPSNELVMRVQSRVYHVKCFTCSSCHTRLVPGDRYSLVNGSILCELDHSRLSKSLVGGGPASQGIRAGHRVSHLFISLCFQNPSHTYSWHVLPWARDWLLLVKSHIKHLPLASFAAMYGTYDGNL